jgi:hypothetical protein
VRNLHGGQKRRVTLSSALRVLITDAAGTPPRTHSTGDTAASTCTDETATAAATVALQARDAYRSRQVIHGVHASKAERRAGRRRGHGRGTWRGLSRDGFGYSRTVRTAGARGRGIPWGILGSHARWTGDNGRRHSERRRVLNVSAES